MQNKTRLCAAAFPGSFDPPTYGHLDIIERASDIFNELVIVAADNKKKQNMFTISERVDLLNTLVKDKANVRVMQCDKIVVDFLQEQNIKVLIRGVRNINDFIYETELCRWNKTLAPDIETIFLLPRAEYSILSSSAVRELLTYGKDISQIVPPPIAAAILNLKNH